MQRANSAPRLRSFARVLCDRAIQAAEPSSALQRQLDMSPPPRPGAGGQTIVIAVGKAAPAMMSAALSHIDGPRRAICVTHQGNDADLPDDVVLFHAGHPVPDEQGLAAGRAVIAALEDAGEDDRVVALISGGGSSLLVAPLKGLTLDDKKTVNRLLLESGLDIVRMNLVRQHLSRLKGGGMAQLAFPAPVFTYILSDVIGDDLRAIASGPTVGPIGTAQEAVSLLQETAVWDKLPGRVRAVLSSPRKTLPMPIVTNRLIGSNRHSLKAMAALATETMMTHVVTHRLTGDVADAAETVLAAAANAPKGQPVALLFGGETTVRITGKGLGGRNQELALRVALGAEAHALPEGWVFLSGGTDGRDGPTDAAGGIVDGQTASRIHDAGLNAAALLADNDSYRALAAAGDLLVTGATGTNVADVQVMLLPG